MSKMKGRIVTLGLALVSVLMLSGMPVFAAEGSLVTVPPVLNQASVLSQTGSLNVLGYIAVGVAMAGLGFVVRKKI